MSIAEGGDLDDDAGCFLPWWSPVFGDLGDDMGRQWIIGFMIAVYVHRGVS